MTRAYMLPGKLKRLFRNWYVDALKSSLCEVGVSPALKTRKERLIWTVLPMPPYQDRKAEDTVSPKMEQESMTRWLFTRLKS